MGLNIGGGNVTNGEGKTMAAIACGLNPEDVQAFIIIARTQNTVKLCTDECGPHAMQMLAETLMVINHERTLNPAANEHDWEDNSENQ